MDVNTSIKPATKKVDFSTSISVGFFLAVRDIRRANVWTTLLTIAVMVLTFLNLVVVSGILVGLIEGSVSAIHNRYLSDVLVSNLKQRSYIEQTTNIVSFAKRLPEVEAVSVRYIEGGQIQPNYKKLKKTKELEEVISTGFVGIDPESEKSVTNLSKYVIEGEFLEQGDYDKVVLGAMLLKKYLDMDNVAMPVMENITIGSKIKININGAGREVIVKGIVKTKVDEIDRRVFFTDNQLRNLIGRFDYNADEIVLKLKDSKNDVLVRDILKGAGFGEYAKIQTAEDAEPKFLKDIKQTFSILGNLISSIGLAVASITVFIVIFINAITRRKFIGILKGIGISNLSIEFSYVVQSIFYALCGMAIGTVIVFGFLKPYIQVHPINFPFSDGILVATAMGTFIRGFILFVATVIAGYIPARIVVKQNTLDAILGR